jgi:hypothetical protein
VQLGDLPADEQPEAEPLPMWGPSLRALAKDGLFLAWWDALAVIPNHDGNPVPVRLSLNLDEPRPLYRTAFSRRLTSTAATRTV